MGSFHTYPQRSGITGIAFSGVNIADAINTGELLSLVQSGEEVFAIFRTEVTPVQAHALSFPEVTAQGETVEVVKEAMAQALQAHFAARRARGETVPMREYKRVDTVEISFEGVVQEVLQTSSPALVPG